MYSRLKPQIFCFCHTHVREDFRRILGEILDDSKEGRGGDQLAETARAGPQSNNPHNLISFIFTDDNPKC